MKLTSVNLIISQSTLFNLNVIMNFLCPNISVVIWLKMCQLHFMSRWTFLSACSRNSGNRWNLLRPFYSGEKPNLTKKSFVRLSPCLLWVVGRHRGAGVVQLVEPVVLRLPDPYGSLVPMPKILILFAIDKQARKAKAFGTVKPLKLGANVIKLLCPWFYRFSY
jgi:hypothetical protein